MSKYTIDLDLFRSLPDGRGSRYNAGKFCALGKADRACVELADREDHEFSSIGELTALLDLWQRYEIAKINDSGYFEKADRMVINALIATRQVELIGSEELLREFSQVAVAV